MNGAGMARKLFAVVVVVLSGSGSFIATSAATTMAAAEGCAGKVYVTNNVDGTVSVITTATGAVSAPIAVGNGPMRVAICPARSTLRSRR